MSRGSEFSGDSWAVPMKYEVNRPAPRGVLRLGRPLAFTASWSDIAALQQIFLNTVTWILLVFGRVDALARRAMKRDQKA